MAAGNKFNTTVQAFVNGGNLNLTSDTQKLLLTNTAPVATNTTYSSISANELASGGGYTTGGATISSPTSTNSGGVQTISGTIASPTWTGSGSGMGPFRYVVWYDVTTGQLMGWWDYGSSISLSSGQTFTVTIASGLATIQ
jgi:hypothetical protein